MSEQVTEREMLVFDTVSISSAGGYGSRPELGRDTPLRRFLLSFHLVCAYVRACVHASALCRMQHDTLYACTSQLLSFEKTPDAVFGSFVSNTATYFRREMGSLLSRWPPVPGSVTPPSTGGVKWPCDAC